MRKEISIENRVNILKYIVSQVFDVDIMEPRRLRPAVNARSIYSKILKESKCTLMYIGDTLGGKDHSTIINYINNANYFIENENDFRQKYYICLSKYHDALGITELDSLVSMSEFDLKKEIVKLRMEIKNLGDSYSVLNDKHNEFVRSHRKYDGIYTMMNKRCKDSSIYIVERKVNQILNTLKP